MLAGGYHTGCLDYGQDIHNQDCDGAEEVYSRNDSEPAYSFTDRFRSSAFRADQRLRQGQGRDDVRDCTAAEIPVDERQRQTKQTACQQGEPVEGEEGCLPHQQHKECVKHGKQQPARYDVSDHFLLLSI